MSESHRHEVGGLPLHKSMESIRNRIQEIQKLKEPARTGAEEPSK